MAARLVDEGARHSGRQLELDWVVVLATSKGVVRLHHLEAIVGTLATIPDRDGPIVLAPLHPLAPSDVLISLDSHVEMNWWAVLWHIEPCVDGDCFTLEVVGLLQLADESVAVSEVLLLGVAD